MSAVETPAPAPTEQPEQRRCPRCGSALTAEQEWCLECGAGVAATVAAPPSWRGPVALVVALLVIAAVALVLALVELAGDPEQVSEQPAAPAQTPAAQTPVPTPAPTSTPTIPPASDPGTAGTSEIAEWPAGVQGWTVVLEAASTESAAQARAQELAQQGIAVGMLNSDEYGSLEPGRFVVFSGQYDSRRAADQALADLAEQVEGAYVRRVAPDAGP